MLIYGRNAVLEALRGGGVERVLVARGVRSGTLEELRGLADSAGVPLEEVPRIALDQALRTTSHQGVAAELPEVPTSELEACFRLAAERGERLLLVLLDQLTDPHNVGAIIRSAEVLGAHGVVMEQRRSAPLSPVVVKTAAGSTSHLPIVTVTNLPRTIQELKERNVWVYGAAGDAAQSPEAVDWDRDAALVIGSEGSGLRRLVRERCDDTIGIPMRGKVASLNASVAAGILIHSIVRGRGGGRESGPETQEE
jgi:23S rRNA (guanosine2251-2'-O)-methyltransferase